ncbi:hypothetical protein LTR85_007791 [Meristemomyces frigidus]|nr:hypothetical protein LTR85_007791 [Meristemomyces frigidus]
MPSIVVAGIFPPPENPVLHATLYRAYLMYGPKRHELLAAAGFAGPSVELALGKLLDTLAGALWERQAMTLLDEFTDRVHVTRGGGDVEGDLL